MPRLALLAAAAIVPATLALWPQPASFSPGASGPQLHPKFRILVEGDHPELDAAIRRAEALSMWHGAPPSAPDPSPRGLLASLTIRVNESGAAFSFNTTAERYTLHVPPPTPGAIVNATIEAATWIGATRALETFTQLVSYDFQSGSYDVQCGDVADEPLYPYRGLLIDTSRHFIDKAALLRAVDAMAYSKMNVLLWHLVDDQSFPWIPDSRPLMGTLGAYPPAETHTYTSDDLREVYEFAMARGVMVQVELDTPEHAASWGKSYPEMLVCNNKSGTGLVNPASDVTWEVEADLFAEVRRLMPGSLTLHLGGDEVETGCWVGDAGVQAWAAKRGLNAAGWGAASVQCEYHRMQAAMVRAQGFIPFVWDDARMCELGNATSAPGGLDGAAIIDVWSQDVQATEETLNLGYKVVVSSMCEYLNHSVSDWKTNWLCDPRNVTAPPELLERIIGAHASRWGEFTDATDLFADTWPGAFGTAEKLWSPSSVTAPANIGGALGRLEQFRCVLVRRGMPISPLTPGFCAEEYPAAYDPPGGM